MIKLKIAIIGHSKSAKSTISNFLSDATDASNSSYRPTKGVRIVEFEMQNLNLNNRNMKAEIELWDCSGDIKYQNCWPAFYRDAQGIVFVYDPENCDPVQGLSSLYDRFFTASGISPGNCLVIEHSFQNNNPKPILALQGQLSRIAHITANVEESGNKLRNNFNNYIASIINGVQDRNEREELNILSVPYK